MGKKKFKPSWSWRFKNKKSDRDKMCVVYSAYKKSHIGEIEFTREDFINGIIIDDTSDSCISFAEKLNKKITDLNKVIRLQDAISEGYDYLIKKYEEKLDKRK